MGRIQTDPVTHKLNASTFSDMRLPGIRRKEKQPPDGLPTEEQLYTDFPTYASFLLWIKNKEGKILPFAFNEVQRKLHARLDYESSRGNRHRLILKYRRPGITTYFQGKAFHLCANSENQAAVTLAHDNLSTQKIFDISLLFYNKLAPWAKPKRKTENKRELNFHQMGSVFYIGTAGGVSFGRGSTLQRVHGSEVAFWPKTAEHATLVAGLLEATTHGEIDFETTANGHGNWFHQTWTGAKNGDNAWIPIFLAWKDDPHLTIHTDRTYEEMKLDTQEEELVKAYGLTPGQLFWRRMKMRELVSPDYGNAIFHQEYPINDVEAFIASGNCFFDAEIIQHLANLCKTPIQTADAGRLKIYAHPKCYHLYVVAADIGEGVKDGDRTIITVMDAGDAEEVACWSGITSPEDAARKMADLAHLYHNALLAPEANSFGHSTINTLLNELGYPHLYVHKDYQAVRLPKDGLEVVPKFGWQTNAKTRPLMISELRHAIQGGLYHVNDKEFFQECLSFADNGHGKFEAGAGSHDDRVIAHAIAWQVRNRQTDLTEMGRFSVDTGHRSIAAQWEDF